jgi:hypothetical protein
MDEKKPKTDKRSDEKRPYRKPELVIYGDLGRITQHVPEGAGALDGGFEPPDNFNFKTS